MNKILALSLLLLLPLVSLADNAGATAKVAIIMDDLGYSRQQGLTALALPGAITYAFIPHSPNARYLANKAQEQNREIILHAPMSNVHNFPIGESGLTETMDEATFQAALSRAIQSVPHISGVNNHMGSLLTQKSLPMEWMMRTLKQEGLYFVDSRTTSQSVAWQTAQQHNIPSLKRDIFLDHERDSDFINQQFQQLIKLAKRRGYAIAIAHPYPETLTYLRDNLEKLQHHGITLVPTSQLVNSHSPNQQQIQAKM